MAQATVPGGVPAVPDDPYALRKEDVLNPPHGWGASLKFLGPGLIMTASIVGSGELIATTNMGATAGFALLWMVFFSCAVKVALQVELARFTIATGIATHQGFNMVPPKIWRLSWTTWLWFAMAVSTIIQNGGILGGVALAFFIWVPALGLPVWTGIVTAFTIALLFSNKYAVIEKGAFYLVVIFVLVTVWIAASLPFTPWGYTPSEILSGLTFQIPAGALAAAIGMFGITGVGSSEIVVYPYWCLEKGYARWTGPADGTQAWLDRAKGWMNVMYKDVFVSFVIYTFATAAFFLLGASVLWRQGLKPAGNEMIATLARMYTDTLGPWSMHIFLLGAVAVLGSTLWAGIPGGARLWTQWFSLTGIVDWNNPQQRLRFMKGVTVVLPLLYAAGFLGLASPVIMVLIGGFGQGLFTIVCVVAIWFLRNNHTDKRLWGGTAFTVLLVLSSLAIGFLGVYSVLNQMGIKIG